MRPQSFMDSCRPPPQGTKVQWHSSIKRSCLQPFHLPYLDPRAGTQKAFTLQLLVSMGPKVTYYCLTRLFASPLYSSKMISWAVTKQHWKNDRKFQSKDKDVDTSLKVSNEDKDRSRHTYYLCIYQIQPYVLILYTHK